MRKLVILLVAVFFVGCGGSKYLKEGKLKDTIEEKPVTDRYITAIGIGAPAPDITNQTQKKASSRNAAIVAAQYQLVSMIKGVKIQGGVTIEKAVETDSKIKAIVDDSIKGAEIVKTEWTSDDGCIVTLRLDKDGLANSLGVKFEGEKE